MKAYQKPRMAGTGSSVGLIPAILAGAAIIGAAAALAGDNGIDRRHLKPLKKVEA